jgi:CubicO group peptidase (beta-lactamase class C family)
MERGERVRAVFAEMATMAGLVNAGLAYHIDNGKDTFAGFVNHDAPVWHWGSCAKALAAAVVAVLVDENVLRFDTTLRELGWEKCAAGATVEHLLRHEAGIIEDLPEARLAELSEATRNVSPGEARAVFVAELEKTEPLYAVAGATLGPYSNAGYILLSYLLERRLGRSWEELVREKVAVPLGMKTLGFGMGDIVGHDEDDAPKPGFQDAKFQHCPLAVHSSVADWANFLALFRRLLRGEEGAMRPLEISNATATHLIVPSPVKPLVGMELPPGYAAGWRTRWEDEKPQEYPLLWHMGTNFVTQSAVCVTANSTIVVCADSGSMMLRFAFREGLDKLLAELK